MVELYLDYLHDLLVSPNSKPKKLELREDPATGLINILNITTSPVTTIEDAF
jgi:hypothetical protein